ncbi:hypothetical protein H257_11065 [Aphanomyces astaci]|uniref:PiggyBac transposable element-derived protein domain-containing protein n=1 Tax=Aphanomyces astaci TaxID=112090 RepID=W4G4D7_APHAT|nr:hypothetical protein H257_11065 [Aphanomyces astaci]ETV74547.1 hypothetical protein H257_11065 [Aphanomyces astaci]|eukprot:XP_009836205.1 hypothetical protein H257_11065 [Aphanomyces astaci]
MDNDEQASKAKTTRVPEKKERCETTAPKGKRFKAGPTNYDSEHRAKVMAFSQAMVGKRVTLNTKKENNSNWKYAHDPRLTRFARLPEAICCYVGQLMLPDDAGNSPSMNVANKARAGISEFYKYNNDGYGTSSWCVKDGQGYGNPMTSPVVLGCFKGLQKEKKATHVTRRAPPMTKPMLKTLYAFLDRSNDTSKSFTLWFKAVTSLSWYPCARMSEVLGPRPVNKTPTCVSSTTSTPCTTEKPSPEMTAHIVCTIAKSSGIVIFVASTTSTRGSNTSTLR